MPSLEDELRSETRCGCYADGAEAHHCVTCRAADRIAELEALLRETHDPLVISEALLRKHGYGETADMVQAAYDKVAALGIGPVQ